MAYCLKDFDYHLPKELIAQKPIRPRDHSRLLLLDRKSGALAHRHFYDLPDYLRPGDLLILNNSKVFPARLLGQKKLSGGRVEVFLHQPLKKITGKNIWECLIGGRAREGLEIEFFKKDGQGQRRTSQKKAGLSAKLIKNNQDGTWQVEFNLSGHNFWRTIGEVGEVPLPPYIKRSRQLAVDRQNYQTVYAAENEVGSAAAPTAGLHFTKNLLKKIQAKGVKIRYVTLHVGLGTFAPVKTEKISDHKMHREFASISAATIAEIQRVKKQGGRLIAVGTTSCRVLESLNWDKLADIALRGRTANQSFWTDIFIYPGYHFKLVDALVTNFHLPKSSLIMLVSALAGKTNIDSAYRAAITKKYRFFSYGDAMFIY